MSISSLLQRNTNDQPTTTVTTDDLLDVIRSSRRRIIIHELDPTDEATRVSDLAETLAEREHGRDYSSNQRKAAYTSIYQTHLPQLDDTNILNYQQNRGIITPGPELEPVTRILTKIEDATQQGGESA